MNFERGQDPKSAMGIGISEKIKKLMEKDGWLYDNPGHKFKDWALMWASVYSDIKTIKWLLNIGANVHVNDDYCLMWAEHRGHTDVVKLLKKYM